MHDRANHPSYRRHRRQVWTQILIPILVVAAVVLAAIVIAGLATFQNGTDPGRWVAISTIWLALPLLFASLVLIFVLAAAVFLLVRINGILPQYSFRAQTAARSVETAVKRAGEMARRPQLAIRSLAKRLKGQRPGKADRTEKP